MAEPQRHRFIVSVYDAHLEFLVDGDGDWFATLEGVLDHSGHDAVSSGRQMEIRYGDFDPSVRGLYFAPHLGGATLAYSPSQIDAVKSLLNRVAPEGASLQVELLVSGDPELRAGGRGHAWSYCEATCTLVDQAPPAPPENTLGLEFDSEIRVEISQGQLDLVKPGDAFSFTGKIIQSRIPTLPEGGRVDLNFAPGAERSFLAHDDMAELHWPLTPIDAEGIAEILQLAEPGGLFFDLDMGRAPDVNDPNRWYVTDVSLVAPSILSAARAATKE